jgi:hypothetical protein
VESVDLDEVGEVEVLVREYQSRLQQVADAAPEEIRRDAAALAEASGEMVAAYEDAGFSVADVDPLVVEELGRSIETTGARVEQFAADECGVSPPAPTIVEGTEDCEAIRRTLEAAIEAYRAMGRGVPPDESALVDAGLLRVESEILDVVDGTIVIPPGSPCEDAPSGS